MILYLLIYLIIIGGVVGAVISKKLLNSTIMLAVASIGVSLLLFGYSAPWAAVFELSVCAGLITVLFISAVSLVKNEEDTTREKQIKYSIFPLILSAVVIISSILIPEYFEKLTIYATQNKNHENKIGDIIWAIRGVDIIAQITLLAGGVFSIKHILSYFKKQEDTNAN